MAPVYRQKRFVMPAWRLEPEQIAPCVLQMGEDPGARTKLGEKGIKLLAAPCLSRFSEQ